MCAGRAAASRATERVEARQILPPLGILLARETRREFTSRHQMRMRVKGGLADGAHHLTRRHQ